MWVLENVRQVTGSTRLARLIVRNTRLTTSANRKDGLWRTLEEKLIVGIFFRSSISEDNPGSTLDARLHRRLHHLISSNSR